jgi:hypothetical protein
MLKINKNIEPGFLLKFKRKNIPKTWYDYNNGTIKSEIKEYVLENEQNKYSEEFINPVIENPKDFLTYNLASGEIIPTYIFKR